MAPRTPGPSNPTVPVTMPEFQELLGTKGRTFMAMMRAGGLPRPLNPDARAVHFRWGRAVVEEFVAGRYKGPMLEGESVPPVRPTPPPKAAPEAPAPVVVAKAAPVKNNAPSARQRVVAASVPVSEHTVEVVLRVHPDGTYTTEPLPPRN